MKQDKFSKAMEQYRKSFTNSNKQEMKYTTVSGEDINPLYTPGDLEGSDFIDEISFPGQYPYTRGIHSTGYRGKTWTMRQFAGFGTPEDTNSRFKYLLAKGQTGLSVAFDLVKLFRYCSIALLNLSCFINASFSPVH